MRSSCRAGATASLLVTFSVVGCGVTVPSGFQPGHRVIVDAHNAYPYEGQHGDRIDRALATGVPIAIEQDVAWCRTATGRFEAVVAHDTACRGDEPTLQAYFFDRIAPVMGRALSQGRAATWPLVILNLDFKMDPPDLHAAVWSLLGQYPGWLTTAPRTTMPERPATLSVGPLLVLTGEADSQQVDFHDRVAVGDRLRLFGAVHSVAGSGVPRPGPATNYRRWWNHPWKVVEPEGQRAAGDWTAEDEARLAALVTSAHGAGLWIRFYTLDGFEAADGEREGWFSNYNFGDRASVTVRWHAAIAAGVDFVATDQYQELAAVLAGR
jgi:hypothetical protein